jgi:ribosomal protein S27AE
MANSKMICAKCGGEMNHHADKLIYSTETSPAGMSANTYFGGIVEETHGCPGCGAVESRRAE